MTETYIKQHTIPDLFTKYEKLVNNLDIVLDRLIDILNDLKYIDPEIKLTNDIKQHYEKIISSFESSKNDLDKEIIIAGSEKKLRGIDLPMFSVKSNGTYIFSYPQNNHEHVVNTTIGYCGIVFDGYVEIRRTINVFTKLIHDVLDFKNHLWSIKESMDIN